MGLKPIGVSAARIRTTRANANTLVKKKDMSKGIEKEESVHDEITLSDQAKMGQKVGETSGMAGRKGSKTTKSKSEEEDKVSIGNEKQLELFPDTETEQTKEQAQVQEKTPQQLEAELQNASNQMGAAINNLPPEKQQVVASLNQKVHQNAMQEEQRTGVPQNRAAMLAKEVVQNEQLQGQQGLQQAAGNFLEKDLSYNQGLLKQAAAQNPGAVAADPTGYNAAMQNPGMDPMMAMGAGMPPGSVPPGNVPPGGAPGAPGAPGGSGSPLTDAATNQQLAQTDMQEARTIYAQMAADRQKWLMRMWQIMQDTQTKINEIIQSVALFRAQKTDEIAQKWIAVVQM